MSIALFDFDTDLEDDLSPQLHVAVCAHGCA